MNISTLAIGGLTVQFEQPWLLLALALVALPLAIGPRGTARYLRAAALALLVVALAQPVREAPGGHVAVVVDVSASVGDSALAAANGLDLGALPRASELLLFASETTRVSSLPGVTPAHLTTSTTDLARALQVAGAGGAGRVLLISDGGVTPASVLAALPSVPVDVLPVEAVTGVALTELLAPSQAAPGQLVEAVAVVEASVSARVVLRPTVGGVELTPIELDVTPGLNAAPFTFRVGDSATVNVSVSLESTAVTAGSDRVATEIGVHVRPPVLVVDDPAMAAALSVQGVAVVAGTVADVVAPINYSAVVVRGSAAMFTPGQLELLRAFVQNGGGLMMTGGPESFGFGAWYRTSIEDVLPVTTDLRTEVTLPLVALVMVVDRSQSMASGNPSKIELAKEGAIQVVELAYFEDLLGLIVFSDEASTTWAFDLRPATERGKREMLQAILDIGTGGGTVLEPAYRMAIAELEGTQAAVKHIIVLSDGRLYDGQGPFDTSRQADFTGMARAALGADITTSTIAIGDTADFERLSAIAEAGGGRYYEALDAATLPRIFTNEALTATRALLIDEPTVPSSRPNQIITFPDALPPVDAYIATSLKPDAQALLVGRAGEPLLAVRRAGLGRTAALTTDLNGWAGGFGAWEGLSGALGTLARWLQAVPSSYAAQVTRDGPELVVVVDAVRGGDYVDNEVLEARFAGIAANLEQVAPGRYVGRLPFAERGGDEVVVSAGGDVVARSRITGPDPEFADRGGHDLLALIAERTGGEVLSGGPYQPRLITRRAPLWPLPVGLALALFVGELAYRRLFGGVRDARPLTA